MQSLLHSPFLQALGYSIINSLWQFAFLWLLYFAINTIFKLSSHQKYSAGLILEVTGFMWFLVTLAVYYNQSLLLPEYNQGAQVYLAALPTYPASTIKQQFFLLLLRSEQFFPYLSIAYLALVFLLVLRWMYAYNFTQQVRFAGLKEIEVDWQLFVQNISLQFGIKRNVGIYLSELVQTPLTIGFLKPIILIPLATINYLDVHQMEAVIVHELAHIKRYDYLFNLLLALVEACLFFNPFMQLIHQQVKKERENCCDDWVLKYKYCASSYARALLKIASNQTQRSLLALNATDDKKVLITRIKRIIEKNENTFFNHKHQLLALLVLTTVFSSLSFLSPSKKAAGSLTSAKRPNAVCEPMAAKVRNPLFNPVFFLADTSKTVETGREPAEAKVFKTKIGTPRLLKLSSPSATSTPADITSPVFAADENDKLVESLALPSAPVPVRHSIVGNQFNFYDDELTKENNKTHPIEVRLERWLPKQGSKQIEIAQNQITRLQKGAAKENNLVLNLEKFKMQLNDALEEVKSSKKQIELNKLQSLVLLGIKKIKKERVSTLLPDINVFKLNELELLQNQIEREIDSIDQNSFFSTRLNSDVNYNFQVPTVVYHSGKEKAHNFSFEYSTTPRVSVTGPQFIKEGEHRSVIRENVASMDAPEDNTKDEVAPAAPAKSTRLRTVYIIKI